MWYFTEEEITEKLGTWVTLNEDLTVTIESGSSGQVVDIKRTGKGLYALVVEWNNPEQTQVEFDKRGYIRFVKE